MIEILEHVSEEGLYEIGVALAELSKKRPDIIHRVVLGYRDGLQKQGTFENLGGVLWMLRRRGEHECEPGSLPIPFAPLSGHLSGAGPQK